MAIWTHGKRGADWGRHSPAMERVTYVRTTREVRVLLRAAALLWLIVVTAFCAELIAQPSAQAACQRVGHSADACHYTLR